MRLRRAEVQAEEAERVAAEARRELAEAAASSAAPPPVPVGRATVVAPGPTALGPPAVSLEEAVRNVLLREGLLGQQRRAAPSMDGDRMSAISVGPSATALAGNWGARSAIGAATDATPGRGGVWAGASEQARGIARSRDHLRHLVGTMAGPPAASAAAACSLLASPCACRSDVGCVFGCCMSCMSWTTSSSQNGCRAPLPAEAAPS